MHLNFWPESTTDTAPSKKSGRDRKQKRSPAKLYHKNPDSIIKFLKKYTNDTVKSIHLPVVSEELLEYLGQNCSQLKTLSFLSNYDLVTAASLQPRLIMTIPQLWPTPFADLWTKDELNDILWQELCERASKVDFLSHVLSTETFIQLGKCSNLRRLTLCDFQMTQDSVHALSNLTDLTHLGLICVRLQEDVLHPHLGWPSLQDPGDEDPIDPLDMMPLFKLTDLRSFTFSMIIYPGACQVNQQFFCNIGKWKKLRCLSLNGFRRTSDTGDMFKSMFIGVPLLEDLEIVHEPLPHEVIEYIANYLKNLRSLTLLIAIINHDVKPDLKPLTGHSSIERLCIRLSHQDINYSLGVYDILSSLPKLSYVKFLSDGSGRLNEVEKTLMTTKKVVIDHVECQQNEYFNIGRQRRIARNTLVVL